MIQQLIHRFLKRRHFWRYATFGEVAELYASRMMTMFALKFVMAFVSVYLYKLGYEVHVIALFWALYYGVKTITVPFVALVLARFGPKHGVLVANLLFATGLCFLLFAEQYGVVAVYAWCVVHGFAGTLNNTSYMTDFSKVKHGNHAGKELGFMNIVEKIGASISPVVGGVIASLYGPSWSILLTIVLFALSAVPLFRSAEQVKTHQKITLKGFPWRKTWRSLRGNGGLGVDIVATNMAWVLFMSSVIFAGDGDELYAKIGILASVSIFVALAASYVFGRLVDHKQGLLLLKSSTLVNSALHLLRPTVSTTTGVLLVNAVNEAAYAGYSLAFIRGEFDLADTPGYRIVYLSLMEFTGNFCATLAALAMALFTMLYGDYGGLTVFYVGAAIVTLYIGAARFPLYKR